MISHAKRLRIFIVSVLVAILGSCASLERSALRTLGNMLGGEEGTLVITGDDDPQLIAEALPFTLKVYEILLSRDPENWVLRGATGRSFVMYSAAFVQMPAQRLSPEQWREEEEARERAKKLFRRGRDYLLEALDQKHEGFTTLLAQGSYDAALLLLEKEDIDTAYWAAMGWFGMVSTDAFNVELLGSLDKPLAILYRLLDLSEGKEARLHNALIQLLLELPLSALLMAEERSAVTKAFVERYYNSAGIGEDPVKRTLHHYELAVTLNGGGDPATHIALAMSLKVREQDAKGFIELLDRVLAIDPDQDPSSKLMTLIYQKQAGWLRENVEEYFLVDIEDLL